MKNYIIKKKETKILLYEYPVVFIKIKNGYEDQIEKIIEELKNLLVDYLHEKDIPVDYIVIDKIPKISDGNIDYEYLKSNYKYNVYKKKKII